MSLVQSIPKSVALQWSCDTFLKLGQMVTRAMSAYADALSGHLGGKGLYSFHIVFGGQFGKVEDRYVVCILILHNTS